LERQVAGFLRDPDLEVSHTGGYMINQHGKVSQVRFGLPERYNSWSLTRVLINLNEIAHPTVMMRRRCWERTGPFEQGFAADYHYWLKSARFLRYAFVPERL